MKKQSQEGFTIIELLIASAVFSLMLISTAVIIVQISRLYYKGTVLTNTQTAARQLVDEISQPIQLENKSVVQGPEVTIDGTYVRKSLCIGNVRYTYAIGLMRGPRNISLAEQTIPHPVWRDKVNTPNECNDTSKDALIDQDNPGTAGTDMLGENMRLADLTVTESTEYEGLYNIRVNVLYGDRDLLSPEQLQGPSEPFVFPTGCRGSIAGSQWCGVATYETKAFKRITEPKD